MIRIHHKSRALLVALTVLSILVLTESDIGSATRSRDCSVTVNAPDQAREGVSIVFSASPTNYQRYDWSVSSGQILSGQGTPSITVFNLSAGSSCTATVEILNHGCRSSSSATVNVGGMPVPLPIRFGEYGNIRLSDEREVLDHFANQLQVDPAVNGYILGYGTCKQEGLARANRVKNYLTVTRGIDPRRLHVGDGGCKRALTTELWFLPRGAKRPEAETEGVLRCQECRTMPVRRPARRRGRS